MRGLERHRGFNFFRVICGACLQYKNCSSDICTLWGLCSCRGGAALAVVIQNRALGFLVAAEGTDVSLQMNVAHLLLPHEALQSEFLGAVHSLLAKLDLVALNAETVRCRLAILGGRHRRNHSSSVIEMDHVLPVE